MVNTNAIVEIVDKITKINNSPCKKTLQKIVFLVENKHIDLGCEYGIHFYGPYSADLDFAVRELCDRGVLKIDYTPKEHLISVANRTSVKHSLDAAVDEIIDKFGQKSPSELELIATALYMYKCLKDKEKIKAGVKKLKGSKYTDYKINAAINLLIETGYIEA